jgi:hypothetical protein
MESPFNGSGMRHRKMPRVTICVLTLFGSTTISIDCFPEAEPKTSREHAEDGARTTDGWKRKAPGMDE